MCKQRRMFGAKESDSRGDHGRRIIINVLAFSERSERN